MKFFTGKLNKLAINKQKEELSAFVSNLQVMDGPEIGHVIALATDL